MFDVIERWLLEGDAYVKGVASIGLLEDLQNGKLHVSTAPSDLERWLRPLSAEAWKQLNTFWAG